MAKDAVLFVFNTYCILTENKKSNDDKYIVINNKKK